MTAILLQSVTSVITKCDRYYKVRQFYYKVRQVLQSAMIITKCATEHTIILFGKHKWATVSNSLLTTAYNCIICIQNNFVLIFRQYYLLLLQSLLACY